MLSPVLTVALLSTVVFANPQERRQVDSGAQFTSAADALISQYINPSVLSVVGPKITSAASAASVTGESLLYSALLATSLPDWFASAIPSEYSSQFAALESTLTQWRSTIVGSAAGATPVVPVVVAQTTTDSSGKTITTSYTTSGVPLTGAAGAAYTTFTNSAGSTITSAISKASSEYSTFTDSAGSTITSAISHAASDYSTFTDSAGHTVTSLIAAGGAVYSTFTNEAGSVVTGVVSTIVTGGSSVVSVIATGASSVGSVIATGASSVGSVAVSGASSVINAASSALVGPSSSSSKAAAAPTAGPGALSGAAGAALGLVGLMIAL